ncbi:MAG TPA: CoB--CoM heterodisulfide reductase iron-sulfur subunit A family protein [Methanomassiliicoccales archaeon]|nr:CoB--CoM heterodisulfide reductase iron-sulfur subunit A family protein [Methanomassiliicoccales archaeon]
MNKEEKLRVGVFICHCGSNIGGFVDVPAVVEYAKTLPDVAFANGNLYTCAEDGLSNIRESIKLHNLNRVVVAACTPRTHAPLFQSTCEDAGLNKYLFTFVNIREQCSWVHMKEKEKATEKAKELIRMGVSRARLLEPQEEVQIDVIPSALVIGGGVAGMSAALSLADQGFPVRLVEKQDTLGGFVRNLGYIWQERKEAVGALQNMVDLVKEHRNIDLYLGSEVVEVDGFIGNYDIVIDTKGKQKKDKVGVIVVATGALEYIPEGLYGYEQYDNVVTLTEFEILAKNKKLPKMNSIAFIQCVGSRGQDKTYCSRICCNVTLKNAMNLADNWQNMLGLAEEGKPSEGVQVDRAVPDEISERRRSRRGRREGAEEAPAAAGAPKLDIAVFNRDIMSYGVEHELMFNKAREKKVRFIRYTPANLPKVSLENNKLTIDYWHDTLQMQRKMTVDMLVLATPLVAQPDATGLSKMLKVPIGQDGFFLEAHVKLRPVDFATDGIYVCGTCKGPADIPEAVEQGIAAASRAAIPLARGYVQPESLVAYVEDDLCTGCGTCIEVCPYTAIRKNEKGQAEVTIAACKGCGNCGATCPENAITMNHFTDEQLLAEARAALQEAK